MKNKNREFAIILIWVMLYDLLLLFLDWLDLKCFLDRGPVTFNTIRQFFSYSGPMIELIIAISLAISLTGVLLKGRHKKEFHKNSEAQNTGEK